MPIRSLILCPAGEGASFRVLSDVMTFKLTGAQTQDALFLCFDQVPPGGGVTMHKQAGQETFLVFEGELEFCTLSEPDGERVIFTASRGDVVHVNEYIPHAYRNTTEVSASMFIFFTPAGAEQFFQKLGSPIMDSDVKAPSLSPELFRDLLQQYGVQLVEEN